MDKEKDNMEKTDTMDMRVIKRNGELEITSFDKILRRIKKLGQENNVQLNYTSLTMKVIDQIYDKIPTTKIDELTAEQCASLSTQNPDYGKLAALIIISNHQKNTNPSFVSVMQQLYEYYDIGGKHSPLISKETWQNIKLHQEDLDEMIDHSRDFLIDYFGFKTLERSYLFKINDNIVERIQYMWMRVSIGIHGDDIDAIKETYDLMSQKYFTHATPTLFNAGTTHPQLSSCYLVAMEDDSLDGIFNTLKDCANISKWAGGIGLHIHNVRANNSFIRGTNGKSSGIVPMLKVFNDTARFINQGGKRNGSFAIYLEPWHADIENFLELKKNHGDEEKRARDLFYALWIPDLFMERIKENGKWSLFCPNECPGLANVYGEQFNELYQTYEKSGKSRKTILARELWFKILDAQMETGTPYILYKDAVNKKSNQKNLGTIMSSNLCVAPETQILTDKGYYEIQDLFLLNEKVNVWNGEEFSEVSILKTGENQELIRVETSDGCVLDCTPYHKFYIQNKYKNSKRDVNKCIQLIEAQNLKEGDKIIKCEYPIIDRKEGNEDMKYAYTHGFFCGDGTYNKHYENEKKCNFKALLDHSYCKRHVDFENEINECLPKQTIETNLICQGISYTKKPQLALYGEKIKLLEYLDYRSNSTEITQGTQKKINISLPLDINEKFDVPLNGSLKNKLEWFSGYCDADGTIANNGDNQQLQICSIEKDFLYKIKLMLNTCGIQSKISINNIAGLKMLPDTTRVLKEYNCKTTYRILITSYDLQKLIEIGFSPKRLIVKSNMPNRNACQFVKISKIIITGRKDDTYCFNEPKKHAGIFNGIITSQCTEITEYSDDKETAVCNLASIALPSFVNEITREFDYNKLHKVTKVVTNNLNKVIDINFYPTEKTRRSNLLHRPIGIGVQGLADAFIMMDIPYHSDDAKKVNKMIFETMYNASLEKSNELSRERMKDMQNIRNNISDNFKSMCESVIYADNPHHLLEQYTLMISKSLNITIKKCRPIVSEILNIKNENYAGAYSSFEGSPASQGILQFDMWNVDPNDPNDSNNNYRYDWSTLKLNIQQYGLRNSLLIAPMPTASTSQILGYNECFEPLTSNIYSRRTLAGEFVVANKYLMRELIQLGLWNEEVKNNIIANKGSVQQLTMLSEHMKNKYKIVWEIPMKHLIDLSADRGAFICQSQSLNLWLEDPTYNTLTSMHFYSWKQGLKTGIYYLRRKAKHQAQQFTLEPDKNNQGKNGQENDEICEMCSA